MEIFEIKPGNIYVIDFGNYDNLDCSVGYVNEIDKQGNVWGVWVTKVNKLSLDKAIINVRTKLCKSIREGRTLSHSYWSRGTLLKAKSITLVSKSSAYFELYKQIIDEAKE